MQTFLLAIDDSKMMESQMLMLMFRKRICVMKLELGTICLPPSSNCSYNVENFAHFRSKEKTKK